jgi:hypothetical protein
MSYPSTWTDKLFSGLIWPAIAGNIAWSFFSVLLDPLPDFRAPVDWQTVGRLVMLAFLAIYLMMAWDPDEPVHRRTPSYYIMDGLCAVGFAVLAVATPRDKTPALTYELWLNFALIGIFVIIGIGHLAKVWRPCANDDCRQYLGMANLFGAIIVGTSFCKDLEPYVLRPIAIGMVVTVWRWHRT